MIDSIKPDPRVLAKLIADHFQEKDLIIIDCAPTESIFTQAAYHASRYVLVPVKPEYFATIGFPLLNESLSKFKKDNPSHQIDVIGVVIKPILLIPVVTTADPKSREPWMRYVKKLRRTSGVFLINKFPSLEDFQR